MQNNHCLNNTLRALTEVLAQLCVVGVAAEQAFIDLASLLFLKMCRDERVDWRGLSNAKRSECLVAYRQTVEQLAHHPEDSELAEIFRFASDFYWQDSEHLATLVAQINALDWSGIRALGTGSVFEAFVTEAAYPDGNPTWPRQIPSLLADILVGLLQPEPGEIVAVLSTGGSLFAAATYAYRQTLLYEEPLHWWQHATDGAVYVHEPDPLSARLARMNAWLNGSHIHFKAPIPAADLVFANLPAALRDMSEDTALATQCALLENCLAGLRPGGRAAFVVSDDWLYHPESYAQRRALLNEYRLHTVLRLPDGIFHGDECQAHVLFLSHADTTQEVWFYDLRSGLPWFDPLHTPLNPRYFSAFIQAYGEQADGSGKRRDGGNQGRFRCTERTQLTADNLDWSWLADERLDPAFVIQQNQSAAYLDRVFHDVLSELHGLGALLG